MFVNINCPYTLYSTTLSIKFVFTLLRNKAWRWNVWLFKVCGLKWSYDNRELASGGNDNRVRDLIIFIVHYSKHFVALSTLWNLTHNWSNWYTAFCLESTFNSTSAEILWAYSSCKSYCMVSSSSWTSRIRWRNGGQMHSFLEYNYQLTLELHGHWKSGCLFNSTLSCLSNLLESCMEH